MSVFHVTVGDRTFNLPSFLLVFLSAVLFHIEAVAAEYGGREKQEVDDGKKSRKDPRTTRRYSS
jgi:hypothetical protein